MLFIVGCQKKVEPEYSLTIRINSPTYMNYTLELNNSLVKSGELLSGWNDLIINEKAGTYMLYYWNKEYYVDKLQIDNYYYQKFNSTITKELSIDEKNKKGQIEIEYPDHPVADNESTTSIIIKAVNGTVKKVYYCLFRSVGFIYADPVDDDAYCGTYWTNRTIYGNFSQETYYCDGLVTKCSYIEGNYCANEYFAPNPPVKYDKCYLLGKDMLANEGYRIKLHTKTMNYFTSLDYLDVYVFTMDLSPDNRVLGQRWGYKAGNLVKYERLQ